MNRGFHTIVTSLIFVAVGILHGLRAFYEWDIVVNGWMVPIWVSWLVVLLAFLMALTTIKHLR